MKLIFFGDTTFSEPSRKMLVQSGHDVIVIGKKDGSLKDKEFFESFKKLNPDLCIAADYGRIIPSRYLEIPKYGFLNIHPSLLPKYRGPSPIQTAILNGDPEIGVSIILVDEEIDHGPILAQRRWEIRNPKSEILNKSQISNLLNSKSNYQQLHNFLAKLGAELLIETLPKYINGGIKPQEQDHSKATFTKKFERNDGRIDWNRSAEQIYNQIRALNPEPGTWATWNSKVINITTCDVVYPQVNCVGEEKSGTVEKIDGNVAVATKTCYLILKQIQLEGGKVMDAKEFINGHPDFLGSQLE